MRTISRLATLLGIVTTVGCANPGSGAGAMAKPTQPSLVSSFDPAGVSPRTRAVEAGSRIQFVNNDSRPHELYSNDCRELASTLLAPGQVFVAAFDVGPKTCHFQDLLAPSSPEYAGIVQVAEGPPSVESNASP